MKDAALIVFGHGAANAPAAGDTVQAHCRTLAASGAFAAVRPAFLRQPPEVAKVLAGSAEAEVFLVPFFASLGYLGGVVAPAELGLDGPLTRRPRADGEQRIHYCEAVGTHPRVAELAADMVGGVLDRNRLEVATTAVLVVGHGTSRNPRSEEDTRALAARLGELRGMETAAAFLEVPPLMDDWATLTTARNVVVLPYLFAAGFHGVEDIPKRLGLTDAGERALAVGGRRLVLCPPLGELPEMAGLIADRAREAAARYTG